ncbi:phospholipase C, phosphocholine-specific [Stagnimonas aquatica]|uniref:phospholipase C n=1 Tax=Stagnimonas aquatica TaxID=2689987 RepID=A0A3N0VG86_9GAMM|nr:phospholipase C, phosphocholine-specific [Stagnimonas aquatica]ROH91702.1 phospholipase C, phosphocholine-specific [Stagnimonas aquatica]
MSTLDRRDFLRAGLYGAGLGLLPPSIARALSIPAKVVNRDITDVQHVVILMQENRSFDHYFGLLQGVRGFGDRFMLPRYNGESMLVQRNASRTVLPYYLDSREGNGLVVGTPHSWGDAHDAWDHGRMTHWPVAKNDVSMGYLKPEDLDYHTALANSFTLCDHYHCALPGGTNSNRIHLWTGTNRGTTARSEGAEMCVVNNDGWDTLNGTPLENSLTWTTYPERLQAAGVSWKVYQFLPDNFTDNPLSGFKAYRDAYGRINNGNLASYSDAATLPPVDYVEALHDNPDSPLYEPLYKGIGKTEPGYLVDPLINFRLAALTGTLPQVSWLVPPKNFTEHPGGGPPSLGACYISQVLDALTANPDTWAKTVFLINYDENDGNFDHLPPPCPPSPLPDGGYAGKSTVDTSRDYMNVPNATNLEPGDGQPYGPGPRVPMLVISPFSRGGYVNSQVHDHTSVIRFLEQRFGVMEPNISPWRRAVMGDLSSAFDFANPNDDRSFVRELPSTNLLGAVLQYAQQSSQAYVEPPAEDAQSLPVQAPGSRPARALPYRLEVRAQAAADGLELQFENHGEAGAVFQVYDRYRLSDIPRRYTVEAGKTLADHWTAFDATTGLYDLWVLGANGFHRLFRGSADSAAVEIHTQFEPATRTLRLSLRNSGSTPADCVITAAAHRNDGPWPLRLAPGASEEKIFELDASEGWYDFTVRGPGGLLRRLAGHLENGSASTSDPEMGAPQAVAAFSFADRLEALPGEAVESAQAVLGGYSGYLPIQAGPGTEFSLDGGPWVADAPPVCAGQSLRLRHRAASTLATEALSRIRVGALDVGFRSKTVAQLPSPDPAPGLGHEGRYGGALGEAALAALGAAALARRALDESPCEETAPPANH